MHINVYGRTIDRETRCTHYHTQEDIIAIKFYCCQTYFPCHLCHKEAQDHEIQVWPKEQFDEKAILCGVCRHESSILDYLHSDSVCPHCLSVFNEGCQRHYHLYFEMTDDKYE
ncbi:CHY zinc finger protein [Thalassobacillus sp. CUG 92003]|uniref:CHY zinc finger protein n=1 Tax=Thalassobacillus sp. CUG 92003 TaxID=2736641 RepID=UPI0015E79797|nr:CHY zinc finger protein [Thalassobacillus sp. CUG 92003]